MEGTATALVVPLSGDLDLGQRTALHERFAAAAASGARGLVIDCTAVTYIDSTAVTELVRFLKRMADQGRPVAIASSGPQVNRVFEIILLHKAVAIFPTLATALHYIAGSSTAISA